MLSILFRAIYCAEVDDWRDVPVLSGLNGSRTGHRVRISKKTGTNKKEKEKSEKKILTCYVRILPVPYSMTVVVYF